MFLGEGSRVSVRDDESEDFMTTEEMKYFQKIIAENCEMKDQVDYYKAQRTKLKALVEIIKANAMVHMYASNPVVDFDRIEGDDADKLIEMLGLECE